MPGRVPAIEHSTMPATTATKNAYWWSRPRSLGLPRSAGFIWNGAAVVTTPRLRQRKLLNGSEAAHVRVPGTIPDLRVRRTDASRAWSSVRTAPRSQETDTDAERNLRGLGRHLDTRRPYGEPAGIRRDAARRPGRRHRHRPRPDDRP